MDFMANVYFEALRRKPGNDIDEKPSKEYVNVFFVILVKVSLISRFIVLQSDPKLFTPL